jgi:hypothetical protein
MKRRCNRSTELAEDCPCPDGWMRETKTPPDASPDWLNQLAVALPMKSFGPSLVILEASQWFSHRPPKRWSTRVLVKVLAIAVPGLA